MFGRFWMSTEVDFIAVLTPLEKSYLWLCSRTKSSILLHKAAFYCVRTAGKTLKELPKHHGRERCCDSSPWQPGLMTWVDTLDYSCLATRVQFINTCLVTRVLQRKWSIVCRSLSIELASKPVGDRDHWKPTWLITGAAVLLGWFSLLIWR